MALVANEARIFRFRVLFGACSLQNYSAGRRYWAQNTRVKRVGRNILLAAFVGIAFCFVFSCAEECHTKHSYESE